MHCSCPHLHYWPVARSSVDESLRNQLCPEHSARSALLQAARLWQPLCRSGLACSEQTHENDIGLALLSELAPSTPARRNHLKNEPALRSRPYEPHRMDHLTH